MAYMDQKKKALIAPAIKALLNAYNLKGSLSVDNHSTLNLNIKSGKLDFIGDFNDIQMTRPDWQRIVAKGSLSVNTYCVEDHYSGEVKDFLVKAINALKSAGWYDNSDIMTDYFDVAYYFRIYVGKWDRPYKLLQSTMNTIIYFHGLDSSPNTEKVKWLKERFPNDRVLAFSANINPTIAMWEVGNAILLSLVDDHSDDKLIFIGTSLGAWLANELSNDFECRAILINPSYNPSLPSYCKMNLRGLERKTFIIDRKDKVIDHFPLIADLSSLGYADIKYVDGSGHPCSGKEFFDIMDDLAKELQV